MRPTTNMNIVAVLCSVDHYIIYGVYSLKFHVWSPLALVCLPVVCRNVVMSRRVSSEFGFEWFSKDIFNSCNLYLSLVSRMEHRDFAFACSGPGSSCVSLCVTKTDFFAASSHSTFIMEFFSRSTFFFFVSLDRQSESHEKPSAISLLACLSDWLTRPRRRCCVTC